MWLDKVTLLSLGLSYNIRDLIWWQLKIPYETSIHSLPVLLSIQNLVEVQLHSVRRYTHTHTHTHMYIYVYIYNVIHLRQHNHFII